MAIIRMTNPRTGFGWPGRDFGLLQNEMNRLFEDFLGMGFRGARTTVYPPVNVYEDTDNVYLTAELPGMEAKDVDIYAEPESINIKGERKIESEGDNVRYHRRERQGGSFSKRITLQTRIATDKVSAGMNNGVLKVTLPKAEEVKPKKIAVKVS